MIHSTGSVVKSKTRSKKANVSHIYSEQPGILLAKAHHHESSCFLPLLPNLRIDVARPTALGGVASGINEGALFLTARTGLRRGGGLKSIAAVGTFPPILSLFLFHHALLV
jgi:hypothetical protein